MQVKKETFKIGPFEFIVDKDNLRRKTACSIQPNKNYFIQKKGHYFDSDLRVLNLR